jgi:two-component system sensor histidine kinase KdpD
MTGTLKGNRAGAGIIGAALAVAVVTGLIYGLREVMPVAAAGVLYLLPVLIVSSRWGLALGVGTSLLSAAAFNFFHIPPTGRFTIADEQNWVTLGVYLAVAAVTSTLAGAARARADEAERRRGEADLTAEMARILLGAESMEDSLRVVGQRIARTFGLPWVEVELGWRDTDERRRALPIVVADERSGTVLVPKAADPEAIDALESRVIPSLETLLTAARQREGLEAQVIETRALRRSNVVKTALLRSVSHDLRSPLTAIAAAAGGLSSASLSDDARAELISVITTESERLNRMVDNLLDLSRVQAGQLEPQADWCSAEELVESALNEVEPPAGGFDVSIEPSLPMFRTDPTQIERALANLIENAVHHAGEEPVTVGAELIGNDVRIRVSDRGPGIPREELERIFEPFHTGGDRGGGTGLGLAIARGFVEANRGTLTAQSLPGQGAAFTIRLPLDAASAAADAPRSAAPR